MLACGVGVVASCEISNTRNTTLTRTATGVDFAGRSSFLVLKKQKKNVSF